MGINWQMSTEKMVGTQLWKAENVLINEIIHGDCLEEAAHIESGSVDLILTDLPYGNMKNAPSTWDANKTAWDTAIDPKKVYEIANRILRKNGKMVLFSQEPYTTQLLSKANTNVTFSYRAIWEKDNFANHLLSKKSLVSYFEDILIFSKNEDTQKANPLRGYATNILEYINVPARELSKEIGQGRVRFFRVNENEFAAPTQGLYDILITKYKIDGMKDFKTYGELKEIDAAYKREYASVFNLWEGGKYKSNIFRYKKDYNGYHPTQKPVLLLEDLIKTFSNEGDTVVDLTAGSGSTLVAAANTGRNFIGIEKELEYVNVANNRIAQI